MVPDLMSQFGNNDAFFGLDGEVDAPAQEGGYDLDEDAVGDGQPLVMIKMNSRILHRPSRI